MNAKETIEKLQLGATVNRLLSAMINTENVASNLFIGALKTELDYPKRHFFKNLYKIDENGSQLIIKEQDILEYIGRKTKIGMGHPMHYYFISVSETDATAFVATGHQFAPLVGAGYHEIWGNINTKPKMISSQRVWCS